jgi:hypothetical protein
VTVDPQRVKDEYFFAACDYYVDGRFASGRINESYAAICCITPSLYGPGA